MEITKFIVLFVILPVAAFIGICMFFYYYFTAEGKLRRLIKHSNRVEISKAVEGEISKIVGRVLVGREPLRAPVTGRVCSMWWILVKEQSAAEKNIWNKVFECSERNEALLVQDDSGDAYVDLEGAVPLLACAESFRMDYEHDKLETIQAFIRDHGHDPVDMLGNLKRFRVEEWVAGEGMEIAAVGECHGTTQMDQSNETHCRTRMRGTETFPVRLTTDRRLF